MSTLEGEEGLRFLLIGKSPRCYTCAFAMLEASRLTQAENSLITRAFLALLVVGGIERGALDGCLKHKLAPRLLGQLRGGVDGLVLFRCPPYSEIHPDRFFSGSFWVLRFGRHVDTVWKQCRKVKRSVSRWSI